LRDGLLEDSEQNIQDKNIEKIQETAEAFPSNGDRKLGKNRSLSRMNGCRLGRHQFLSGEDERAYEGVSALKGDRPSNL
jgi:hypothetical protein